MEEKKNESQVQGSDGSAEKNKMGSILAGYGGKRRTPKTPNGKMPNGFFRTGKT